ncbi:MAG: asparagine synthase (glutamine-hydrolyzing), partial [Chloroflexota bacterium]
MCGIFGLYNIDNKPGNLDVVRQATTSLHHRGPDDEGYLLANSQTGQTVLAGGIDTHSALNLPSIHTVDDQLFDLAFGFRRLSILDLSPAGHQPMATADKQCFIVFNGEIYNYLELRAELMTYGYQFRTQTDTEVVLAAYQQWGVDCLSRFNGMWGFAIWDTRRRQLFCARDRFGIKPFYYWFDATSFIFASEIKALLELPQVTRQPNDAIIYDYLTYGYVDHTEETFFSNIKQILPAHYLLIKDGQLTQHRYWDIDPNNIAPPVSDESVYHEQFYNLFEDAIRIHLRSDVPIGTCLSGGLDSSSIVCVANKLLFSDQILSSDLVGKQQKTFSFCVEDHHLDEREYIEHVLSAINGQPNYVFPQAGELIDDIPQLMWHQDEPFVSTSMYAQWRVMKMVSQHGVKVLLDGQGGDEVLAGYNLHNYYWASLLQRGRFAELLREISAYRNLFSSSIPNMMIQTLAPHTPLQIKKIIRLQRKVGLQKAFSQTYQHRLPEPSRHYRDHLQNRLYGLLTYHLLPSLLRYEDRNSMAFSIESRVPFLDYRLVEYLFSLPANQKIQSGYSKAILRKSMVGVLPKPVQMRTSKLGYSTPEKKWLSGGLNNWMQDLLNSDACKTRGYLDVPQIMEALDPQIGTQRELTSLTWRWANL